MFSRQETGVLEIRSRLPLITPGARNGSEKAGLKWRWTSAAFQYLGTLASISSDHALMPPLPLLTYLNPCCFKKLTAFKDRTPPLQCK
jgi:hypothetical protein